jgi:hypothetical protein
MALLKYFIYYSNSIKESNIKIYQYIYKLPRPDYLYSFSFNDLAYKVIAYYAYFKQYKRLDYIEIKKAILDNKKLPIYGDKVLSSYAKIDKVYYGHFIIENNLDYGISKNLV